VLKHRHDYRKAIAVAAGGLILAVTSSEISGFILPGTKVMAIGGGATAVNVAPMELSLFIGIFLLFLAFRRR
jgi:vacuolar-type H+-ATPase subunit I/STV1